jgi:hypothetical protein
MAAKDTSKKVEPAKAKIKDLRVRKSEAAKVNAGMSGPLGLGGGTILP